MELLLGAAIMLAILLLCSGSFYGGYAVGKRNRPDKHLTPEQEEQRRKRQRIEDQFNKIFAYNVKKGG